MKTTNVVFINLSGEVNNSTEYGNAVKNLNVKDSGEINLKDIDGLHFLEGPDYYEEILKNAEVIVLSDRLFFDKDDRLIEKMEGKTSAWIGIITRSGLCARYAKRKGIKHVKTFYREAKSLEKEKKNKEKAFQKLVRDFLKCSDKKRKRKAGFKK